MALVRPEHLEQFASSEFAPLSLGELIRRLIYCWISPDRIDSLTFHSGTANNLPRWDGQVALHASENEGVHRSVWELSTQNADAAKMRKDFEKRLSDDLPEGWTRKETTLVLVTLRKLKDRQKLEAELRNSAAGKWQDVRLIDSPALAQWIEKCPAVETWCAEELKLGDRRFGRSLGRYWKDWSEGTRPPISSELVLAGREDASFKTLFSPAAGQTLSIQADSPQEAVAFLHAMLDKSLNDDDKARVFGTCLVIDNEDAANRYSLERMPLGSVPITVLLPPATGAAGLLANRGHYVVTAVGRSELLLNAYRIRRGLVSDVSSAFQKSMRMSEEVASTQARTCGSSVT